MKLEKASLDESDRSICIEGSAVDGVESSRRFQFPRIGEVEELKVLIFKLSKVCSLRLIAYVIVWRDFDNHRGSDYSGYSTAYLPAG